MSVVKRQRKTFVIGFPNAVKPLGANDLQITRPPEKIAEIQSLIKEAQNVTDSRKNMQGMVNDPPTFDVVGFPSFNIGIVGVPPPSATVVSTQRGTEFNSIERDAVVGKNKQEMSKIFLVNRALNGDPESLLAPGNIATARYYLGRDLTAEEIANRNISGFNTIQSQVAPSWEIVNPDYVKGFDYEEKIQNIQLATRSLRSGNLPAAENALGRRITNKELFSLYIAPPPAPAGFSAALPNASNEQNRQAVAAQSHAPSNINIPAPSQPVQSVIQSNIPIIQREALDTALPDSPPGSPVLLPISSQHPIDANGIVVAPALPVNPPTAPPPGIYQTMKNKANAAINSVTSLFSNDINNIPSAPPMNLIPPPPPLGLPGNSIPPPPSTPSSSKPKKSGPAVIDASQLSGVKLKKTIHVPKPAGNSLMDAMRAQLAARNLQVTGKHQVTGVTTRSKAKRKRDTYAPFPPTPKKAPLRMMPRSKILTTPLPDNKDDTAFFGQGLRMRGNKRVRFNIF